MLLSNKYHRLGAISLHIALLDSSKPLQYFFIEVFSNRWHKYLLQLLQLFGDHQPKYSSLQLAPLPHHRNSDIEISDKIFEIFYKILEIFDKIFQIIQVLQKWNLSEEDKIDLHVSKDWSLDGCESFLLKVRSQSNVSAQTHRHSMITITISIIWPNVTWVL